MNIFRKFIWKILGLSALKAEMCINDKKYNEYIDTLHFFLNTLVDIKAFPKDWDSDLFIMQQCDVQLLRIVTALLEKHEIKYWMDYGTLLGAVRHDGFIPWDDDMDISTIQEDYDKIIKILPSELERYNIDFKVSDGRIGISYKHEQTGIWLDVFAYDELKSNKPIDKLKVEYEQKNKQWLKDFLRLTKDGKKFDEDLLKQKIFIFHGQGDFKYLMLSPLFLWPNVYIFKYDDIFPLNKICFAGYQFYAPANSHNYLVECYGNKFMNFPKNGVLHHDMGRGPLSTWAKSSGIEMYDVHNYLKNIADHLSDKSK